MDLFSLKTEQSVFFVTFNKDLTEDCLTQLKSSAKSWLATPHETFVLDFTSVQSIHKSLYPLFVLFGRDLKTHKKFIYSLGINKNLSTEFKQLGIEGVFNPISDIKEIYKLADKHPNKNKLDVDFIKPFIIGAQQAFGVQANTPVQPEKPYAKSKDHAPEVAITGVITISSKHFKGTIALSFPKNVFLSIYKSMIGEDHTEITSEIQDACGELLNILFGVAKAELNNKSGYEIEKALPVVLSGEKLKIQQTTALPVIVMPFKTPYGHFYLEIVADVLYQNNNLPK